jgi:hypothetical protein
MLDVFVILAVVERNSWKVKVTDAIWLLKWERHVQFFEVMYIQGAWNCSEKFYRKMLEKLIFTLNFLNQNFHFLAVT